MERSAIVSLFSLSRFRALAFGQRPDHPMENEAAARALLADLPVHDAAAALAELTHWAASLNVSEGFSAGRRIRVLMILDETARAFWRELGALYLVPSGERPVEKTRGNPALLRALFDSAAEFSEGYRLALYADADGRTRKSSWVEANWALLGLRQARWLGRRLTLARMLHRQEAEIIWHHLHTLYAASEARGLSRTLLAVFPGDRFKSSIKQEYVRLHLTEMADLAGISAREIELVFRIAGQLGIAAQLETTRLDGIVYLITRSGIGQPQRLSRVESIDPNFLYLNTANCLPRLQNLIDRDATADACDTDTLFGRHFTLGERRRTAQRLLSHWGANPPVRRAARETASAVARVLCGFGPVAAVLPLFDQGTWNRAAAAEASVDLRIQLDDEEQAAQRAKAPGGRQFSARLLDASSGGIGLATPGSNARNLALGKLLAVQIGGAGTWLIGVVRRVEVLGEEWHLGIQSLTRQPQLLWFHRKDHKPSSPWDMERASGHEFLEHFQCAILLRVDDGEDSGGGQLLIAAGATAPGAILEVPLAAGLLRIRISAAIEAGDDYVRAAYEPLARSAEAGSAVPAGAAGRPAHSSSKTQKNKTIRLLTGNFNTITSVPDKTLGNTGKHARTQRLQSIGPGTLTAAQETALSRTGQNAKTQKLPAIKK